MNYDGPKIDLSEDHGNCFACEAPLGPDPLTDEALQAFCDEHCQTDFYERADEQRQSDLRDGSIQTAAQKNVEAFKTHQEVHAR